MPDLDHRRIGFGYGLERVGREWGMVCAFAAVPFFGISLIIFSFETAYNIFCSSLTSLIILRIFWKVRQQLGVISLIFLSLVCDLFVLDILSSRLTISWWEPLAISFLVHSLFYTLICMLPLSETATD
jgi:hypothetical protein